MAGLDEILLEIRQEMGLTREAVDLTREAVRTNSIVFREGSRLIADTMSEVIGALRELRDESRAHTEAIFKLIDRLEGGGATA